MIHKLSSSRGHTGTRGVIGPLELFARLKVLAFGGNTFKIVHVILETRKKKYHIGTVYSKQNSTPVSRLVCVRKLG